LLVSCWPGVRRLAARKNSRLFPKAHGESTLSVEFGIMNREPFVAGCCCTSGALVIYYDVDRVVWPASRRAGAILHQSEVSDRTTASASPIKMRIAVLRESSCGPRLSSRCFACIR
jgi:hypothetical protein